MRTATRSSIVPVIAGLALIAGCGGETQGAEEPTSGDSSYGTEAAEPMGSGETTKLDQLKSAGESQVEGLKTEMTAGLEAKRTQLKELLGDKLEVLTQGLEKLQVGGVPLPGIADKVKSLSESVTSAKVDYNQLLDQAKSLAPQEWVTKAEALLSKLKGLETQLASLK